MLLHTHIYTHCLGPLKSNPSKILRTSFPDFPKYSKKNLLSSKSVTSIKWQLVWMSKRICEEFSKLFTVINLEKQCKISLLLLNSFSSVQSLSHVPLFATPWTAACQASLSITNFWSWLKLMSTDSVMPSNHLLLCHPLLFLPSIFPSIRVFSNESVLLISWLKYWSFSFSISRSNEYSGLISFRMD